MTIEAVRAWQVLDSRGTPTVAVEVRLTSGDRGWALVPSGASTSRYEVVELRDGDVRWYRGRGVSQAVQHVNDEVALALRGQAADDQRAIDAKLWELDGTPNKSRLGANAVLGVSLAVARAAARARRLPLYAYLRELYRGPCRDEEFTLPMPMVNIISGGLHAGKQIEVQDVLVIPYNAPSYRMAMAYVFEVYQQTRDVLQEGGYEARLVADEGGLGPRLRESAQALAIVTEAIRRASEVVPVSGAIAVDVAASHFGGLEGYRWQSEGRVDHADDLIERYHRWLRRYPIVSLEDAMAEDDLAGWVSLTKKLGSSVQLLGDDVFATRRERLQLGMAQGVANAVLIKPNQVGTLTETLDTVRLAQQEGYQTVVSARSGDTEDPFIVDLALGVASDQIKIGSITRSERLAKYNRMFRLEERFGVGRIAHPFSSPRYGRQ